MVRSHVSFKKRRVFGLTVIRKTTFPSWSWGLSTASSSTRSSATPKSSAQGSDSSRPIPVPIESGRADEPKRGDPDRDSAKNSKTQKMRITHTNGVTRLIPKYLNGCKNSWKISWKKALLNLMEPELLFPATHTRALPMKPL